MQDSDLFILLPFLVLGLMQLSSEGKLNFKGLIIEPILSIISFFRR